MEFWGLYVNSLVWKSGQLVTHLYANASRANKTQLRPRVTCAQGHKNQHLPPGKSNQSDRTTDLAACTWCWHQCSSVRGEPQKGRNRNTLPVGYAPAYHCGLTAELAKNHLSSLSCAQVLGQLRRLVKIAPMSPAPAGSSSSSSLGNCRWLPAVIGDHVVFPYKA